MKGIKQNYVREWEKGSKEERVQTGSLQGIFVAINKPETKGSTNIQ